MNRLTANFTWNNKRKQVVSMSDKLSIGVLDLFVNRIRVQKLGNFSLFYNDKTNKVTAMIGYISNLDQVCNKYNIEKCEDLEIIEKLYNLIDIKLIGELEGVYTAFIWDETKNKGFFFQDEFGSNLPLYYARTGAGLCISSSLKEILKRDIPDREMNLSAMRDYMIARTIVPNKQTFIKGVCKLTPKRYLVIDGKRGSFRTKLWHYPKQKVSMEYAKKNLIDTLKQSIYSLDSLLQSKQRVSALSAGYDSNAILHYLSNPSDDILAITIGGKKKNEIGNAKKLAEHYNNVKHLSAVVEENKLSFFPDIVWRNEGYICESGLFLQYELANLLKKQGVTAIFCGEGADQILNQFRRRTSYHYIKNDLKSYVGYLIRQTIWHERFRESKLFKYIRRPSLRINYDIELDYIVKKSGILQNSFGIQLFCPFLNRHLVEISTTLGELNISKNYFKQEISQVLGESKTALISKAGGSTDVEYLFEGYDETITALLDHSFYKPLISKKRINQIKQSLLCNSELIIRLLYLFVFNILFISGEYDSQLQNEEYKTDLKKLLDNELKRAE